MVTTMKELEIKTLMAVSKVLMFGFCFYILAVIVTSVTDSKFKKLKNDIAVASQVSNDTVYKMKQLDCLTKNVYWEAASEPFEGKVAVAQVTLNRVASGKFGEDICTTVYQKNIVYEKIVCQFSWVCEGIHKIKPIMSKNYADSEEVAKKVYLENFRLPSLTEAMYFHADYVSPGWRRERLAKIGRHVFYK